MRSIRFLACLGLAASMLPAQALERLFPPTAKRGTLSTVAYPSITMNGQARQLSPGAWIRNANNTVDMPASLRGHEFVVNYTENPLGQIDRVWILTPTEAQAPAPSQRLSPSR
jgi:hypothetical protein